MRGFALGAFSSGRNDSLMRGRNHVRFFLCSGKPRRDFRERFEMTINVRIRMRHRNRPLLIPPIGLRHHSAFTIANQ